MTDLPAMERTRLRVLASELRALGRQVAELSPETRARIFGEGVGLIAAWETLSRQLHAESADAPEPTQRATTMGAA